MAVSPTKSLISSPVGKRVAVPVPASPIPSPMASGTRGGEGRASELSRLAPARARGPYNAPVPADAAGWSAGENRTCNAWVLDAPGPITTLRLEEAWDVPPPGPTEVRVWVKAVSLNPSDYQTATEKRPTYPHCPGYDVAGVVDVVGHGVRNFKPGDRVYFHGDQETPFGGYSELALASTIAMRHIPDGMSFDVACALPSAAWTAHLMLFRKAMSGRDGATQTVFITAGGGGVGSFALQLARRTGARILTTCGALNAEWVTKLGAHENFNYRGIGEDGVLARIMHLTDGHGVDVWLDTVGPSSAIEGIKALKYGGTMVCASGMPALDAAALSMIEDKALTVSTTRLSGVFRADPRLQQQLQDHAAEVEELMFKGELDDCITEFIDWKKLITSLTRMQRRHFRGKTVFHHTWTRASQTTTQQRYTDLDPPRPATPTADGSDDVDESKADFAAVAPMLADDVDIDAASQARRLSVGHGGSGKGNGTDKDKPETKRRGGAGRFRDGDSVSSGVSDLLSSSDDDGGGDDDDEEDDEEVGKGRARGKTKAKAKAKGRGRRK